MEQYIINQLALAKAQLEVTLFEKIWLLEQKDLRIKELEELLNHKENNNI